MSVPVYSIVVPVYNEAGSLRELHARLAEVMRPLGEPYELILVDDGSTDDSLALIKELAAADKAVKAVSLSRNFGHQAALGAGLDRASGRAVIFMDADLQHPPRCIPEMISRWREGYEVVGTIRRDPPGTGALKRLPSRIFYKLMDKISDLHLPAGAADFRLVGPRAAAALRGMRERARFFRGLSRWVGYRQCWVEFTADVRFSGSSGYSLAKMTRLALDGVTSFSTSPLRLSVYFGLVCAALSFAYIVYALYIKFFHQAVLGWTSTLIAVLFLGGVQLVSIGILGEYVGRIYEEAKGRKPYLVAEEIGFPGNNG